MWLVFFPGKPMLLARYFFQLQNNSIARSVLTPGFDPKSLKVAQLRGILLDNEVEYASNAPKSVLVQLFKDNIASGSEESQANKSNGEIKTESTIKSKKKKANPKESRKTTSSAPNPSKYDTSIADESDSAKATAGEQDESVPVKLENDVKQENVSQSIVNPFSPENTLEGNDSSMVSNPEAVSKSSNRKKKPSAQASPQHGKSSTPGSNSRKRKSMLDELDFKISESPGKGKLFITTDSDDDIESPQKKRLKPSPRTNAQKMSASPKASNAQKSQHSSKIRKARKSEKQMSSDVSSPVVSTPPANSSPDVSRTSIKSSHPSSPVLASPVTSRNNPNIPSQRGRDQTTNKYDSSFSKFVKSTPQKVTLDEVSSDTSHSFDSALAKLKNKPESNHGSSPSQKEEEFAKILEKSLGGIKPKSRENRNITPRRPIVIQESALRANHEQSVSSPDLSDDELSDSDKESTPLISSSNLLESEGEKPVYQEKYKGKGHSARKRASCSFVIFRALFNLSLFTTIISLLVFGYWYREQTFLIGYCGSEINRRTIPDTPDMPQMLVRLGEYLDDNFKPECVECPPHARCFPMLEMACYEDFVLSSPWYYSYLPNFNLKAQKCVPDTKKAEKIEIMIDVALDLLRARNANQNCGRSPKSDLTAGIELSELHELLLALKAPYITNEEFEDLWQRSVTELEKEPEIIVRQVTTFPNNKTFEYYTNTLQIGFADHNVHSAVDTNDTVAKTESSNKVLRSTSVSHISVKCVLSNTLVGLAMKFKYTLAAMVALMLVSGYSYWKYKQHVVHVQKIDTLYKEVLSKLKRQAKLANDSQELPPYVGSIQLRDLILSSENNLAHKMRLWESVSHKVDRNSNVKHELLEIHGEVMKVWQWISTLE